MLTLRWICDSVLKYLRIRFFIKNAISYLRGNKKMRRYDPKGNS